ncbi:MAG: TonB-dependent receptor [Flavobacteriales bacterium]|nr:TonB-dependent receptor [Flavobacteriales bacterium]
MRYIFTLLPLCIGSITLGQSTGEIHGRILDAQGEPVPLVSVAAWPNGTGPATEADMEGRFVLKPLQPGTYTLRFSFTGYKTFDLGNISVGSDRITRIGNVEMEGTELPTLVIEQRIFERPLIDPEQTSVMTLLAEEMERDPNRKNVTDMIVKSFPGITPAPNGDGMYFRGSRADAMAYFVDGVKVTGRLTGVTSAGIRSISVYTGALPARYGDVTGGVVVIDSKTYQEEWARRRVRAAREADILEEVE